MAHAHITARLNAILNLESLNRMENQDMRFISNEKTSILKQITKAVMFLNRAKIIHLDIKPSNFLLKITEENELKVVLTDFGISQNISCECEPCPCLNGDILNCNAPELVLPFELKSFDFINGRQKLRQGYKLILSALPLIG